MSKLLYFIGGAVIGGLVGWLSTKDHYKKLADEDIESVKEVYRELDNEKKDKAKWGAEVYDKFSEKMKEESKPPIDKTDSIKEYVERLGKYNYGGAKKKEEPVKQTHYLIPPEKFGEFDPDYETANLTYYADNVLADDEDYIFENADEILGDFYNHFGEFEEYTVFVRNDDLCCDYEITRDNRPYEEVVGEKPKIRWKRKDE